MGILRLLAIGLLLFIGGSLFFYVLTGRAIFLRRAWKGFRVGVVVALVFFSLLILERLAIIAW